MSRKLIDLTGQIFGRLTVESYAGNDNQGAACWNCRCLCGTEKIIPGYDLRGGRSKSCGCLQKEITKKLLTTHGLSDHPLYSKWDNMHIRCYNPNNKAYHNYGGRGIAVCDRWHRDNPEGRKNFIDDMYPTYKVGLSIERIDNNLGYSPENCKWATYKEQNNNTRRNRMITYQGETLTLQQWSEKLGIKEFVLYSRIFESNWSIEKAFSTT